MRSTTYLKSTLVSAFLIFCVSNASATETKPLLHPLFSDHAVLQRDRPVTIWGWAAEGTEVTVSFAGQSPTVTSGVDGGWSCVLEPMTASSDGRLLEVKAKGENQAAVVLEDILVGDVWLCSGQSNMEMGITLCEEDAEIAQARSPSIRLMNVPKDTAFEPQETFAAAWQSCSPRALSEGGWGGFSAAAYFFGKELHQELNIPIGLIHSSWGGTVAEAWVSADGLEEFPEFIPQLREVNAVARSIAEDPEAEYLDRWFQTHDAGTAEEWFKVESDSSEWSEVGFPGSWADCGIPGFEGVVWARRRFEVPAAWANKPLVVNVGEISDNDTTWINGEVVGRTNQYGVPRHYPVEAGLAKPGLNTIALRVTNAGGGGVFTNGNQLSIHPVGDGESAVSLSGPWRLKATAKKDETGRPMIGNPQVASVLYNGMIAPLTSYGMTGVIWYQGEANGSRAHQYRELLPALVEDWRMQFQHSDLAFHIVSLANYQGAHDQPRDSEWAELREAQAMTAKGLPHCGLAVTIDIGDANDIHPKNKRDVGKRLALSALAQTYERSIVASGPWFRGIRIEGSRVHIDFDHIDGGLKFKGSRDLSFAVAGKDRTFHWAKAEIDGDSVVVSSLQVAEPIAVRYAWDINPEASLYNGAGLPAVPFRSDDWPMITEGKLVR